MTRRGHESIAQWMERIEEHAERLEVAPHYVYRAFDSYGHLLYIGCTNDVKRRMATHKSQAPWHRFAETLGTTSFDTRTAARSAEKLAIDSEASYFNSTQADINRTQASINAAKRALWSRDWYEPRETEIDPREDWEAFSAAIDAAEPDRRAWRRALDRERERLRGAYPFMTDRDRLDRYLAAREDAELARQQQNAA